MGHAGIALDRVRPEQEDLRDVASLANNCQEGMLNAASRDGCTEVLLPASIYRAAGPRVLCSGLTTLLHCFASECSTSLQGISLTNGQRLAWPHRVQ